MNEAKPLAEKFGVKYEYKKLMNAIKMDFKILYTCVEKILSQASPTKIANVIKETLPYEGVVEFLEWIKSKNYETHVITDNPLAELPEVKEVLKQKFPIEEIHATTQWDEEKLSIKGYISKPEIFRTLYYNLSPQKVIGILQGENDYELAKEIKKYGGTVIVANSNSKSLQKIADYKVSNTIYLPRILKKIEI